MPFPPPSIQRAAPSGRECPATNDLALLLIGDIERPEFREAASQMRAACRVVTASNIAAAIEALAGERMLPDLIVIAQSRPGEHNANDLERLRRRAMLAPVVLLVGSWSEGETRSGDPLPGVTRVYWHQWSCQFERQISMFRRGECPPWAVPPTGTDIERLLWPIRPAPVKRNGTVAIVAQHIESADWLADTCAQLGLRTIRATLGRKLDEPNVSAVLWDMIPGDNDVTELAALRESFCQAPIVIVAGFPRVDDHQRLLAAGAAAVLSKPLSLEDLDGCLDRVISASSRHPTLQ